MFILVYGSLKKGYWNHERFSLGEPLKEVELPGFELRDLGFYPCAVCTEDPEDKILCELYEVDGEKFFAIHCMERAAGYVAMITDMGGVIWVFPDLTRELPLCSKNSNGVYEWHEKEE